ncbi:MAG: hypothetical protein IJY69_01705 [Clostridia bacterium]|nr:hypothetical protein [Clostridia bacterium]
MSKIRAANNIDRDFFAYIYHSTGENAECADERIKMYLEPYLKSDITDMVINVFAQTSLFPSKVMTWTGDVVDRKTENGMPVDYSQGWAERPTKDYYMNASRDPIELVLYESRKAGKTNWLSVRMNDVHGNQTPTNRMRGDLYYEVKKRGMFLDERITGDFYKSCFDYSHEYVRQMMLDYIDEVLNRYDFEVLELDFTREMFCLNYLENPNCHKTMTEFIENVYKLVKKRNGDMRIAVRLCRDPDDALIFGFDVREWIRLGLVDVLIPSPRFRSTDSDMPIEKWLELARGTKVEIHAGLEFFIHERLPNNIETLKGFIAAYLDAGADMIYLYNYYRECAQVEDMTPWLDKVGDVSKFQSYDELRENEEFLAKVWQASADISIAKSGTRRNVMTFKEDSMTPRGERPYRPLPCLINGTHRLTMQTGYVRGERVNLILGVGEGEAIGAVKVDGNVAKPLGRAVSSYMLSDTVKGRSTSLAKYELYAFSAECDSDRVRKIDVEGNGITLGYLEFEITAD